jgi:hypothetical protein
MFPRGNRFDTRSFTMDEHRIACALKGAHPFYAARNVRNRTKFGWLSSLECSIKMQKIYYHGLGCRGSACSLQKATAISRCANALEESEQFSLSQRMYSVLQLVPYHVGDLQDAE